MDVLSRFSDLFSNPTDAFKDLGTKPFGIKNILTGLGIYLVIIVTFSWLNISDPVLKSKMIDERLNTIEKSRKSGLISDEEAVIQSKTMAAQIEKSGAVWSPISYAVTGIFVYFIVAFYFYLGANFLGTIQPFSYQSALSINTVFALFNAVQIIVTNSLFIIQGNFHSTLGVGLLINNYDEKNVLHMILTNVDVFAIAYIYFAIIALKEATGMKTIWAILMATIPFMIKLGISAANILMGN